jgi:putative glycosyltransferase (TIGR04372 family)
MRHFYIHYSAIGNAIMMGVSLWKHILNKGYAWSDVKVDCQYSYVKEILSCIPELAEDQIEVKPRGSSIEYESFDYTWGIMKEGLPLVTLKLPKTYSPAFKVKKKSICFHVREDNIRSEDPGWLADKSYYQHEPERFVKAQPYVDLALKYACSGWQIVVLGDAGSTAFPEHKNIFNLCHLEDKTLSDDFYALSKCSYVVASTSCMQVAGRAFDKKVLHTDIMQPHERWWFGNVNLFKKLIHKESNREISHHEFITRWGLDPFKIPYTPTRDPAYELINCTFEELHEGLEELMEV